MYYSITVLQYYCSWADATAVNPKGIKTILANGLITFSINGSPAFNNGPRSLPRNHPNCTILDHWVFDNLIWVDDLLAKSYEYLQLVY